jgi:hypothetical protein
MFFRDYPCLTPLCRAPPFGEPRTPQTAGAQDRAACYRQRSRGLHGTDLVHASKVARFFHTVCDA